MYIKIYKESQLVLLRQLNLLLGKYQIPREILMTVKRVMSKNKLGKSGFVAIFLNPLTDSEEEIKTLLDCYPKKIEVGNKLDDIFIQDENCWMTKRKEWYLDYWKVVGEESSIYMIYSVKLKKSYDLK